MIVDAHQNHVVEFHEILPHPLCVWQPDRQFLTDKILNVKKLLTGVKEKGLISGMSRSMADSASFGDPPNEAPEAIPADRLAALKALECGVTAVIAGTREGLRRDAMAVHPELPPFALLLLRRLEEDGPSTPGALAARLKVANSAISRQTRQLGQLGLVRMKTDATDRRIRIIALTPKAIARLQAVGPGGPAGLELHLLDWDTEDLQLLAGYIGRLAGFTDGNHQRQGKE